MKPTSGSPYEVHSENPQQSRVELFVNDEKKWEWSGDATVFPPLNESQNLHVVHWLGTLTLKTVNYTTLPLSSLPQPPRNTTDEQVPKYRPAMTPGDLLSANWSKPVNLGPDVNSLKDEISPALSADEKTIYFMRSGQGYLQATRSSVSEPFGPATPIPGTESWPMPHVAGISVTPDGLTILYCHAIDGNQTPWEEVFISSRESVTDPFPEPVRLGKPVNTVFTERAPVISADGLEMLVGSQRLGKGKSEIMLFRRDSRSSNVWKGNFHQLEASSPEWDAPNTMTYDMLGLFSSRQVAPRVSETYYHTRTNRKDDFGPGQRFQIRAGTMIDPANPFLSADGQRLYFQHRELSSGKEDADLWMVERLSEEGTPFTPPPDHSSPVSKLPTGPAPQPANTPFDVNEAKAFQREWASYLGIGASYKNSLGMQFQLIPPGTFQMGITDEQGDQLKADFPNNKTEIEKHIFVEQPLHPVTITNPFYLQENEVTVADFQKFVDATGYITNAEQENNDPSQSWRKALERGKQDTPVTYISWLDAIAYTGWLSKTSGHKYRLPTEAEWEFSGRAGTQSLYGNEADDFKEHSWFRGNADEVNLVKQKRPNPFGVYDLFGNAGEWCLDHQQGYPAGTAIDPLIDRFSDGKGYRMLRGGNINSGRYDTRPSKRGWAGHDEGRNGNGFRVVLELLPTEFHDYEKADRSEIQSGNPTATTTNPHELKIELSKKIPKSAKVPFDPKKAVEYQKDWAEHLGLKVEYENSIGMNFRILPPGEFMQGVIDQGANQIMNAIDDGRLLDALKEVNPAIPIKLTKPIYMGAMEVSQEQYQEIMQDNPSQFRVGGDFENLLRNKNTNLLPITNISWFEAVEFCNRLSEREQLTPCYQKEGASWNMVEGTGYRLPTEAEWEFACRGGNPGIFWFGAPPVLAGKKISANELEKWLGGMIWSRNNFRGTPVPVDLMLNAPAGKSPHPFGLFNMSSNVAEMVYDLFEPYPDQAMDIQIDPARHSDRTLARTSRGGVANQPVWMAHTNFHRSKSGSQDWIGFRVVRNIPVP